MRDPLGDAEVRSPSGQPRGSQIGTNEELQVVFARNLRRPLRTLDDRAVAHLSPQRPRTTRLPLHKLQRSGSRMVPTARTKVLDSTRGCRRSRTVHRIGGSIVPAPKALHGGNCVTGDSPQVARET